MVLFFFGLIVFYANKNSTFYNYIPITQLLEVNLYKYYQLPNVKKNSKVVLNFVMKII